MGKKGRRSRKRSSSLHPVLSSEGPKRHKLIEPEGGKRIFYIDPIPGTNVASDQLITFDFETTSYWHFPRDPLYIRAKVTYDDVEAIKEYETKLAAAVKARKEAMETEPPASDNGDSAYNTALGGATMPERISYSGKNDGIYINPHLLMSSAFEKVEIEIQNERIPFDNLGKNIYQCLNRQFTSNRLRGLYSTKRDGELLPWDPEEPPTGKSAPVTPPKQAGITDGNRVINDGKTDSKLAKDHHPVGSRFSIDGAFLLGPMKCLSLLAAKEKREGGGGDYEQKFTVLRPGTRVRIRLTRANPDGKAVGNYKSHQGAYMSNQAITEAKMGYLKARFEISELCLVYELYEFDRCSPRRAIMGSKIKYTMDTFMLRHCNLEQNQRVTNSIFQLNPGTKLVYLFFAKQYQVYFDPSKNRAQEMFWEFPAGLATITIKVNGEPYKWPNGLTGITKQDASYGTSVAENYWREQMSQGFIDNDFWEIFPHGDCSNMKDVVVVEFLDRPISKRSNLSVECIFDSSSSPSGYLLTAMSVFEQDLIDLNGSWSHRYAWERGGKKC